MNCPVCNEVVIGERRSKRYCSVRCRELRRQQRERFERKHANRVAQSRRWRDPTASEQLDLAWLAGIIDGEGHVAFSYGGSGSPHLRVQITNGSQAILDKATGLLRDLGVLFFAFHEQRGTTNIMVGTEGALRLHQLIRHHLVRQVERYDAGVAFMRPHYDGRLRVWWTAEDRAAWKELRRKFHPNAKERW